MIGRTPSWGDTAVGVAVLALAAVIAWQTTLIPTNAIYAQVGPKVIPWIATAMLIVLGALLTLQGLRGGWKQSETDHFARSTNDRTKSEACVNPPKKTNSELAL